MNTLASIFLILFSFKAFGEFNLTVETGVNWQFRNDVQIPNDSVGNRFDFSDFDKGPFFHHRFESLVTLKGRHHLRVVYAPLSFSVEGRLDKDINFNEVNFNNSDDILVNYKFNSYRLGYVYNWIDKTKHKISIGLTLKIREADIRLSQTSTSTSTNFDNLGLVPLLYFSYAHHFSETWSLFTNADFAVAPQGRAFDVALKVRKKLNDHYSLGFGYRLLEGGADNDEVFTFSLFHYSVFDLLIRF